MGENTENMKNLSKSINKLPILQHLDLNLSCNNFSVNPDNMKYLRNTI